ncbi:MAG: hypothetical protein QG656_1031 [Candidatus Hydrogenedentes bacterium]|nr:hypothetical protein [Candidatus Hydrogenedentota bacterium]
MRFLVRLGFTVCLLTVVFSAFGQDQPVQITFGEKGDCDPMVSPDGKSMAFASDRTGAFNLYLQVFGQGGVLQLTQSKKGDRHPSWSPDGKQLVFNSKRTGNGDIYEMAADGSSGFLQLTDREDIDEFPSYKGANGGLLYVSSPKKLLKLHPQNQVVYAEEKGRANNVRAMGEGAEARFSPDLKSIVFVSRRTKNKDLWLMNTDGGLQTQLTTDSNEDENPCFSPDGKQIVFTSNRTGSYDLWAISADGSNPRQLTSSAEDETQPCWSSGGFIYYTRALGEGRSNIYRIPAPK